MKKAQPGTRDFSSESPKTFGPLYLKSTVYVPLEFVLENEIFDLQESRQSNRHPHAGRLAISLGRSHSRTRTHPDSPFPLLAASRLCCNP